MDGTLVSDAFVFVLLAVLFGAVGALAIGAPVAGIVKAFGNGFWDLIPFTLQASLVVIGGYVVASSPVATRVIGWLASIPRSGVGAVTFIAAKSLHQGSFYSIFQNSCYFPAS